MSTFDEALAIKTLWRSKRKGEGENVSFNLGIKEIHVGWDKRKEEPLKVIEFNPEKDGVELYSHGKLLAAIILVEGSISVKNVGHIQRLKNAIQIFSP